MERFKNKKAWISAAFICVLLGVALSIIGRILGGAPGFYFDGSGLHTAGETIHSENIRDADTLDAFDSIELDVEYADVELVASDRFAIEYCISEKYSEPVYEVKNNKLIFNESRSNILFNMVLFYGYFGTATENPRYYVRIEFPKDTRFTNISLNIESGNLDIASLQADVLKIRNEYGDISLTQYKGNSLDTKMESGNLSISALDTARATIDNEYGQVRISDSKGDRLDIQMDSGNCQIDRLGFSNTKIKDEYGDISLGLPGELDSYGFDLCAEYGDIRVGNEKRGFDYESDEITYQTAGDGEKTISISCESGNIEIYPVK